MLPVLKERLKADLQTGHDPNVLVQFRHGMWSLHRVREFLLCSGSTPPVWLWAVLLCQGRHWGGSHKLWVHVSKTKQKWRLQVSWPAWIHIAVETGGSDKMSIVVHCKCMLRGEHHIWQDRLSGVASLTNSVGCNQLMNAKQIPKQIAKAHRITLWIKRPCHLNTSGNDLTSSCKFSESSYFFGHLYLL